MSYEITQKKEVCQGKQIRHINNYLPKEIALYKSN